MAFDIRATVSGTAESKEKALEAARILRELLADHGFIGIMEVRELGSNDAFIREVVRPDVKPIRVP
jgi:hypothetical protein